MIEKLNVIFDSLGLLFLISTSGYITSLLSCGMQYYFTNNMLSKHLLLFLIIMFYVLLFSRDAYTTSIDNTWAFPKIILSSIIIYLLFILMGKLQPSYVVVLLIALILHMLVSLEAENKDEGLKSTLSFIQLALICFIVVVIIIGVTIYYYKQYKEQGKDFEFSKFILGVPKCKRLSTMVYI